MHAPLADPRDALRRFIEAHARIAVLTGAGCSTGSGVPDYRDEDGRWKRPQPISYREFVSRADRRRRYWARSLVGWRRISEAEPNAAHRALAALEASGRVHHIVTQNVDGLHQRAGSRRVIDLHGRLDEIVCLGCSMRSSRAAFQHELARRNPSWVAVAARPAPDGDADLDTATADGFDVPDCEACGGLLKPGVVFFGETVPPARVQAAYARVREADALLVVGSSLMVFSGLRFVRDAVARGMPVAILNRGRTRADEAVGLKIDAPCEPTLDAVAAP